VLWRLDLRAQRPPSRNQSPFSSRPTGRSALLRIIAGKAVLRIIHLQYFAGLTSLSLDGAGPVCKMRAGLRNALRPSRLEGYAGQCRRTYHLWRPLSVS